MGKSTEGGFIGGAAAGRRRELGPDRPGQVSRVSARVRGGAINCCPAPINLIIDTGATLVQEGWARAPSHMPESCGHLSKPRVAEVLELGPRKQQT